MHYSCYRIIFASRRWQICAHFSFWSIFIFTFSAHSSALSRHGKMHNAHCTLQILFDLSDRNRARALIIHRNRCLIKVGNWMAKEHFMIHNLGLWSLRMVQKWSRVLPICFEYKLPIKKKEAKNPTITTTTKKKPKTHWRIATRHITISFIPFFFRFGFFLLCILLLLLSLLTLNVWHCVS